MPTKLDKRFLTYNLSKLAKKKGFDEECLAYYEFNSFNKKLTFILLNYFVKIDDKEFEKRPGLYSQINKNSKLPQWAFAAPLIMDIKNWIFENKNIYIEIIQKINKNKKLVYICSLKRNGKSFLTKPDFNTELSAINFGIKTSLFYI